MTEHVATGHPPVPCLREKFGRCRICELTEVGGPHYSEGMRRLFHPEEFPEAPPVAASSPVGETAVVPVTAIPAVPTLAGDLVERLAKRIGADRAAKFIAAKLGTECGCDRRRVALNRVDSAVRKYLGLPGA